MRNFFAAAVVKNHQLIGSKRQDREGATVTIGELDFAFAIRERER